MSERSTEFLGIERQRGVGVLATAIGIIATVGAIKLGLHEGAVQAKPPAKAPTLELKEPTIQRHRLKVGKTLAKNRRPKVEHHPVWENQLIDPTAIVLHWTAVYPKSVDDLAKAMSDREVSVQIFIDKLGKVHQLTDPVNTLTAHAEGVNDRTIGIEIEGSSAQELLDNLRQLVSVVETVRMLTDQFNIPRINDVDNMVGIVGHDQIDGSAWDTDYDGKTDVGPQYLNRVISLVNKYPAD